MSGKNAVNREGRDALPVRPTDAWEDMDAYDNLPRPIRLALAFHPEDLAAGQVLECWKDPTYGPPGLDVVQRAGWFVRALQEV